MATEWTAETFENHINAAFDEVEAGGNAASSTAEITRLQDWLSDEWYGAKPGAFLATEQFDRLKKRLGEVSNGLTKRFVEMRNTQPPTKTRVAIEEQGPTLENFFHALHYSASEESKSEPVEDTEKRLGVRLPAMLRELYGRQDGGPTDFYLIANSADPAHLFESDDDSAIHDAYDVWLSGLPGNDVMPRFRLKTIGHYSDQIDFGDESWSWRSRIPESDRLVAISSRGSDIWCCLDYRDERAEPKVVLFDDTRSEITQGSPIRELAPDFETFFSLLRRHAVTEEHGRRLRSVRKVRDD